MTSYLTISRSTKKRADLLDVLDVLKGELGSATNAAVQCIRDSPRFQTAKAELDRQNELQNHSPTPGGGNGADTPNSSGKGLPDNDES